MTDDPVGAEGRAPRSPQERAVHTWHRLSTDEILMDLRSGETVTLSRAEAVRLANDLFALLDADFNESPSVKENRPIALMNAAAALLDAGVPTDKAQAPALPLTKYHAELVSTADGTSMHGAGAVYLASEVDALLGGQVRTPDPTDTPVHLLDCLDGGDILHTEAADEIRRLRETRRMRDWQPIDTAPRGGFPEGFSGTRLTTDPAWVEPPKILAMTEEGIQIVYWDWYYAEGGNGYDSERTAWVGADGEPLSKAPTHWMPLPDPPK